MSRCVTWHTTEALFRSLVKQRLNRRLKKKTGASRQRLSQNPLKTLIDNCSILSSELPYFWDPLNSVDNGVAWHMYSTGVQERKESARSVESMMSFRVRCDDTPQHRHVTNDPDKFGGSRKSLPDYGRRRSTRGSPRTRLPDL